MAQRIFKANPRGIGKSWTPGCYCCGGEDGALYNDCSFFVPSRETGEAIVAMFASGAVLDYREREPDWIQVKIGACDAHLANLRALVQAVVATQDREDGPGINAAMIRASYSVPASEAV